MSEKKRKIEDVDPEYIFPKREKSDIVSSSDGESYSVVRDLISKEFNDEINSKEKELNLIQERLTIALKTLHLLRYVCVTSYYGQKTDTSNEVSIKVNKHESDPHSLQLQKQIHPEIKRLLGKSPVDHSQYRLRRKSNKFIQVKKENIDYPPVDAIKSEIFNQEINVLPHTKTETEQLSVKSSTQNSVSICSPSRNQRYKEKHQIVVGNISKWMPSENKLDKSTHKWMVYVRGPKENSKINHFVKKVRFFLHPSYQPNDIIDVTSPPFHLTRRGWGEFPLRIQIHFHDIKNKPIDIIHNLKLDHQRTGRQTLGSETVVDIWLYSDVINNKAVTNGSLNGLIKKDEDEILKSNNKITNGFISQTNIELKNIVRHTKDYSDDLCQDTLEKLNDSNREASENTRNIRKNNNTYKSSVTKSSSNIIKNDDEEILCIVRTLLEVHNYCKTPNDTQLDIEKQIETEKYKIHFIPKNFGTVTQALNYLFRRIPLVNSLASNEVFGKMYTFVACSEQQYLSWNIGKQFCAEWCRSKMIKQILTDCEIPGHHNWSLKSIIQYSRLHGFSLRKEKCESPQDKIDYSSISVNTYSHSNELIDVCKSIPDRYGSAMNENEEIDILGDAEIKEEKKEDSKDSEMFIPTIKKIEHNKETTLQQKFIRETAKEIGITLKPEEIKHKIFYPAAEKAILVAVKCLAEELIRKSLAIQNLENSDREISKLDVFSALLKRNEFDVFLNTGLENK